MKKLKATQLKSLAAYHRLEIMGIASLRPGDHAEVYLDKWQKAGYAADMGYMLRKPSAYIDAARLMHDVATVIMFAVPYDRSPHPELKSGWGRVARYAWGRDYHRVLKKRLKKLGKSLAELSDSDFQFRVFSDAVPLLERAFAASAALGFTAKNTMLIRPGTGSYFFIAEMLINREVEGDLRNNNLKGHCGGCSRCLSACPTGALVKPYTLDSRRCISYLTIEKRGELSLNERTMIGEWLFGCDLCQECCPFNYTALKISKKPELEEFGKAFGPGPQLELSTLLRIRTHDEFVKRFGGTAIMRATREGLLRNAAAVSANTCALQAVPALLEAASQDSSALVRQHTLWALSKLYEFDDGLSRTKIAQQIENSLKDPATQVVNEVKKLRAHTS
ncbi:MAG: tRNA epoxyqueuosine(34) reductase QueG [Candidatus Dadabacteria bacterium]|nr:MAG: tRNA epoxyqueuosine(34) reductase QueG [Candidatus Dadabacteria bacterium]